MKNILFIVVDCLGYKFLTKDKRQNYPYLNYLFSEGVSFSQAISVASTTNPSIASMLTGCYPFRHGIMTLSGNYLGQNVPFLPELLKSVGYNTYAEVTGPLWPELGFSRGFDHYNYRYKKEYLTSEWGVKLRNKFISGYFKKPWFVILHIWDLHVPRQILPNYNKNTYGASYERALRSLDHSLGELLGDILDLSDTVILFTGDHGEQIEKNRIDRVFKRVILKTYKNLFSFGFMENHRVNIYRKYQIGHGSNISDTLVRIPLLLITKDKVAKNVEIDAQISHVDILPTLLSILEIERFHIKTDGQSYMTYLDKQVGNSEHAAYMQACGIVLPDPSKWLEGIRYKGFKYIRNQSDNDTKLEWLYNLKNDPEEKYNIKDAYMLEIMRFKLDEIKKDLLTITKEKMTNDEIIEFSKKLKELGYM